MNQPPPEEHRGPDAARRLLSEFKELEEDLRDYFQARRDLVKANLREAGLNAAVIAAITLIGGAILFGGALLLLSGIAGGIAAMLSSDSWVGQFTLGLLILLLVGGGGYLALSRYRTKNLEQTKKRYELRRGRRTSKAADARPVPYREKPLREEQWTQRNVNGHS